ncbi:MAG: S1C family serine protease [Patescibacteria group bacterium]
MTDQIKKYSKKTIVAVVIITLFFGSLLGSLAGFLAGTVGLNAAAPYLAKIDWGQGFFSKSGQHVTISVNEESETIDAVAKASPSVVSIVITKELTSFYNISGPFDFFNNFFEFRVPENKSGQSSDPVKRQVGGGSGFIISAHGLIITNKHVVSDESAEYTVVLSDGSEYPATVLGRDIINDIAVIKIEAQNLPVLELGDSDNLRPGQTVIAIGNALGEYSNTVTKGVISGINRQVTASDSRGMAEEIKEAIQTDAAINPGNSGGPLINLSGQVVGVNTAVSSDGQLVGFAIPINAAKQVIDSVKEHGRIITPWLGVRYVPLNAEIAKANNLDYDYGALIIRGQRQSELAVSPGSPADKAGLEENDIILEINDQKLDADHLLGEELLKYGPGDKIEMLIFHDGQEKSIKVTLEERVD